MKRNRNRGLTISEMIIVIAIIALFAGIAIPNLVKARDQEQANLKKIDEAKKARAESRLERFGIPFVELGFHSIVPIQVTQTLWYFGDSDAMPAMENLMYYVRDKTNFFAMTVFLPSEGQTYASNYLDGLPNELVKKFNITNGLFVIIK